MRRFHGYNFPMVEFAVEEKIGLVYLVRFYFDAGI